MGLDNLVMRPHPSGFLLKNFEGSLGPMSVPALGGKIYRFISTQLGIVSYTHTSVRDSFTHNYPEDDGFLIFK